ncbi:DUF3078 domain-containing protein [Natronoflexus pectinivorans]|uniref:DUF3078 family protein n=1 Tax=Natronoflexus pectinivorans TaxID=682526 RepID=A0A4R2G7D0_9BACT|nr:DUF3078 domain-containing protein [Natronoflexus pectinivorans]TCO03636.1 DUF3078 family protein [Natronoflexus pectinivorans]
MYMRFLFGLLFLIFLMPHAQVHAQRPFQIYFSDFVLPETWYEKVDAMEFREQYREALAKQSAGLRFQNSFIAHHPFQFILEPQTVRSNVSAGLIRQKTGTLPLNEYRFEFMTTRISRYKAHALPVMYIKEELPDLTEFQATERKTPFEKYQHFLNHPGGSDTLQTLIAGEVKTGNEMRRHIYYNHPYLVQYDWHELPDPPRIFRSSETLQSRTGRESLEGLFRPNDIRRPDRLERVALKKSPWTFTGSENIQFSQAYLSNWARGGQNSVALLSDLRLSAIYKDDNVEWENTAVHKLGIISSEGAKSRVNDDLIELMSKYGVKSTEKWYYSLLFNFRTQFFEGFLASDTEKENPISAFMAPAYFSLAAGMDYRVKDFTLLLSPLTSRMTVVLDTAKINQTRYNIDADKKSNFLTGGSLQNNFRWKLAEDMTFTSRMNVFYDYFAKDENIQAEWDLVLDMRINVFLSTRLTGSFRYYESESSKLQIRQGLSLSFRYNF